MSPLRKICPLCAKYVTFADNVSPSLCNYLKQIYLFLLFTVRLVSLTFYIIIATFRYLRSPSFFRCLPTWVNFCELQIWAVHLIYSDILSSFYRTFFYGYLDLFLFGISQLSFALYPLSWCL